MKKRLFILIMFLVFIIPMNTNALVKPSIYKNLVKDNDFRYGYLVYPSNENYEINNFAEFIKVVKISYPVRAHSKDVNT